MAAFICPRAASNALRSIANTRLVFQKTPNTQCLKLSASQSHHQYHTALRNSRQPALIISKSTATSWSNRQLLSSPASSKPSLYSAAQRTFSTSPRASNPETPSSNPINLQPSRSAGDNQDILTWNRFFDLRKRRRYINLVSSIFTGSAAVVVLGPLVAAQDIDGMLARATGFDPFMMLGLAVFAIGGAGWLCGPTFGSAVFRSWAARKGWSSGLTEKEKSFFDRIKRYRADPTFSSPQNPIVDYYGEKITSVKDYRRWLKDQKAFNKKKDRNLL